MADFDGIINPPAGYVDVPQLSNTAALLGGPGGPLNAPAEAIVANIKALKKDIGALYLRSLADFNELDIARLTEGLLVVVDGFYPGSNDGGGSYQWKSGVAKSSHDGGTIIDPGVPHPGGQGGLALHDKLKNYFDRVGAIDPAGSGCFILTGASSEVSVMNFGAVLYDDAFDNYYSIRACAKYALSKARVGRSMPRVRYPAGELAVSTGSVFSAIELNVQKTGLHHVAVGKYSTTLKLVTGGIEKWFGKTTSFAEQFVADQFFTGFNFTTDDVMKGNGFSQLSNGTEKRFRFFDCVFILHDLLECNGTGNADLNVFRGCSIYTYGATIRLNNPQSVCNRFIDCDHAVYGDFAQIVQGGYMTVLGGSVEQFANPYDTVTDHFLVRVMPNVSGMGLNNQRFIFENTRHEVHGARSKIVSTPDGFNGPLQIDFVRASFGTVTDGARVMFSVLSASTIVTLDECAIHQDMLFLASANTTALSGSYAYGNAVPMGANIRIRGGMFGPAGTLRANCTVTGNLARISADGVSTGSGSISAVKKSQDFDIGWHGAQNQTYTARTKAYPIKNSQFGWPSATAGSEVTFSVPAGSYVKKIYLKRPATSASSLECQFFVGNSDKSVVLGQSVKATFNDQHVISVEELGFLAFTDFRIWAVTAATNTVVDAANSVGYVEYV